LASTAFGLRQAASVQDGYCRKHHSSLSPPLGLNPLSLKDAETSDGQNQSLTKIKQLSPKEKTARG
jgi:hypothetical protein